MKKIKKDPIETLDFDIKNDTFNPFKKIAIILLLIIILGLIAFLVYYIFISKENIVATKIKEDLNTEDIFVKELYDNVKLTKEEDAKFSKLNNVTKLYLAYRKIPNIKYTTAECSLFSEVRLEKENDLYRCISTDKNSFSQKDLEFEYHKLFGNGPIKHENIITNTGIFKYVSSKDLYIAGEYLGGSADVVEAVKSLSKAYKENNKVYLLEKVKYINKETGEKITKSKKYTSGTYKYTFQLIDNNYVYKSKELVE